MAKLKTNSIFFALKIIHDTIFMTWKIMYEGILFIQQTKKYFLQHHQKHIEKSVFKNIFNAFTIFT